MGIIDNLIASRNASQGAFQKTMNPQMSLATGQGQSPISPQMPPQMPPQQPAPAPASSGLVGMLGGKENIGNMLNALSVGSAGLTLRGTNPMAEMAAKNMAAYQDKQQELKQTSAYVEYLRKNGLIDEKQATQLMASPKLAAAITSAAIERNFATPKESFTAISGDKLVEAGYSVDPNKTYNVSSTGKITQVGGNGTSINFGDNKIDEAYAKQVPEALSSFTEKGSIATRQNSALNNLQRALSGVDTGGFAETKQTIMSFADRLGLPIDTESLSNVQGLQAAARQIVADELRMNKGPQTDFDARFAETYLPGLGQQKEANDNILSYLKSRNRLESLYGKLASGRSYEFASDKQLLSKLNTYSNTLGSVIESDGDWITFDEFYSGAKDRGASDMEILDGWSEVQ